jgi:hypothetical protein
LGSFSFEVERDTSLTQGVFADVKDTKLVAGGMAFDFVYLEGLAIAEPA